MQPFPPNLREDFIRQLFAKDITIKDSARGHFLSLCFSNDFLEGNRVKIDHLDWLGYERTAATIILDIDGDYYYSVEIPFPKNPHNDATKASFMGRMKFRADRIKKTEMRGAFCKMWRPVQMPTYDWKKCFEAIKSSTLLSKIWHSPYRGDS